MDFEEFVEKETNKEFIIGIIVSVVTAFIIGIIIAFFIINDKNNCFAYTETEYKNVYEFKDTTWFIIDRQSNEYVFQPCELGDWDYELKNKEELSKIMATYFINKYNVEETKAIQEINKILEEVDI